MERGQLERSIKQLSTHLEAAAFSPSADDVDQGLGLLEEVDTYLKRSVFDSDLKADNKQNVVILGTTGAGKSTVASFLFGKGKVAVHHESPYARVLIAESPLPGVIIQSGPTSATLLPVVNHVSLADRKVAVWDMPGGRDTRGPFVELVVHFVFKWMLKEKDLRFVIVSPPLHERPQTVTLQGLINGSLVRADNAVVVYTKCGTDFDPDITSDLDIEEGKRGIRSFALSAPVKSDPEGHNYSLQYHDRKLEILKALEGLRSYAVEFEEPLPAAAARLLDQIRECCVGFARDVLSACFLRVYAWDAYAGTIEEIEGALNSLKTPDALSFESVVDILLHLVPLEGDRIRSDPEVARAARRLSLVGTIDGTTNDSRRHVAEWLNAECICAIEEAKEKLVELRNAVLAYSYTEKYRDLRNVLILSSFQLRLSSELPKVHKFVEKHQATITSEAIPGVIFMGYGSLEVDTNLQMWANVTLVSPSIQVTTKCAFDLSARGQAKMQRANGMAGTDGGYGKPGFPGGNLLVVCGWLEDPDDMLRTTSSRGQLGGDGQNGGDGVNGADSEYCLSDFKNAVRSAIDGGLLADEEGPGATARPDGLKVDSCMNHESPPSGWFFGTRGIYIYTVVKESVPGGKGIRPGGGGIGGAGGEGGRIRLQVGGIVSEAIGCQGRQGSVGAHGKAARDGRASPSFSAIVQQWYFKGGGLYSGTVEKPTLVVANLTKEVDLPPMMGAELRKLRKEEAAQGNSRLGLRFVQERYEMLSTRLKTTFPQCDFSNLKVTWEATRGNKRMIS
ncbi:uncharacterized protein KRP23_14347 [Phytophthora ramorum]|uniref:uncharacterized protein n=1 Tax=Phytophthora ramorum TaxID=164328 RepID=UPI0030B0A8E2|nr:hypothetical protein KRP23_14347 [Phytophthora ramorum]